MIGMLESEMKVYAFVFARSGSKRLKNKNLLELAGKPLVQHSVDFALSADFIDRVFVSSDSEKILNLAKNLGAESIQRPPELATDESPEIESWKHAVNFVMRRYGDFDKFVSLPPTSPLRRSGDVKSVIDALKPGIDYSVSMTKSSRSPWFSMVTQDLDGLVRPLIETDVPLHRHQDSPESYDLTAVAFATTPGYVKKVDHLWDGVVSGVEVSRETSIDIDDEIDFEFSRALIGRKNWV
jgi:N-acylneuraminate cytidylyltransferase